MRLLLNAAWRRSNLRFVICMSLAFVSSGMGAAEALQDDASLRNELIEVFGFMPAEKPLNAEKTNLGRQLFHDPRLSKNNQVSCATCHILEEGGDDGRAFSIGVSGAESVRNSPTVFNLSGHIAYFWDGRSPSLEAQIDGPIHHPDEMGSDWQSIVPKLSQDKALLMEFRRVYGALDERSIKDAIVTFEKSLTTDDSSFDQYLRGDTSALSEKAKEGANHFLNFGCSSCHQGYLVGGNLFQKFGVYRPQDDNVNAQQLFKVPSLRNVEHTAPYFHDGRQNTLEGAVRTMADAQLGRPLSEIETANLVAFLKSLSSARFVTPADELVQE